MAYWAKGLTSNEPAVLAENSRKAFALRAGVSEPEKLRIEISYYYFVTGNLLVARRGCEIGAQMYPRDWFFVDQLRIISNALGQYEAGLKASLEMQRRVPPNTPTYRSVIYTYLLLNRSEEAAAAAKEAHAKNLDSNLVGVLYGLAFYRNDAAEMARQAASAAGKPGEEDLLLALEADTFAYVGHLGKAREFSRRAADSAQRADDNETAATYYAISALREALFGNAANARRQAAALSGRLTGRDMEYGVALALAYAGEANRAQTLADEAGKSFPDDTVMQFDYLPTLHAKIALSQGKPQEALETLARSAQYELGLSAIGAYNWPNLYPIYVRGEAYLALHQGGEAAAEFQKILDHRGIALNEPIGALAHLQLGRAYTLSGDSAKAKAAYQNFLTLWKDADLDIPILKQAKAEYAKLR